MGVLACYCMASGATGTDLVASAPPIAHSRSSLHGGRRMTDARMLAMIGKDVARWVRNSRGGVIVMAWMAATLPPVLYLAFVDALTLHTFNISTTGRLVPWP